MNQSILALILAVVLTACTTTPVTPPAAPEPAPVVEPEPQPPVGTGPDASTTLEAAPIIVDISQIQNATPAEVLSYMGTPSLVRRDENVQVMIFETATCVVEVIFYEPDNGDHFRSEWVTARSRGGQDTDTEPCMRQWLEQSMAGQ